MIENPDEKLKSLDHVRVRKGKIIEIVKVYKAGKHLRFESEIEAGIIKVDTFKQSTSSILKKLLAIDNA